jgi:hypothetical protein
MTTLAFISLTMSVLASCIIVSYEEYAKSADWPVGRLFIGTGWLKGLAGLNALGTVGVAWMFFSLWWALGVFVAGWVLSFFVIIILKKHSQMSSILIFIASYTLQFFS